MQRALRWFAPVLAPALMLAACGDGGPEAKTPTLRIKGPSAGSSVGGNVVRLDVEATGIRIVKADGDTSGETGHYHVFIDREPLAAGGVIPKEGGIVHSADDPITIYGLLKGEHQLTVVLGDGAHARIGSLSATTTVTVDGPAIDATAPAPEAGKAFSIEVGYQGVQLVPAAEDTASKTTGHLHVLIDRDQPAASQAIPKETGIIHTAETTIEVPGLAAGEHTIWVVLADANHVPFDPPVLDKLTITVA